MSELGRRIAFVLLMAITATAARAQPVLECEEALQEAEDSYLNGLFSEAVDSLSPCLDEPEIPVDQALAANRLLALAYLRLDQTEDARSAIRSLFTLDPDYQSDPVNDPPSFTVLVEIVRQEVREEDQEVAEAESGRSWFRANIGWLVSGGTVVAGGILAAVLLGGGSGDPGPGPGPGPGALPEPPTLPN